MFGFARSVQARRASVGRSRGPAGYFEAAWEILAAEGAEGLTQAALCERLHVTTGAFYYHFANMPAFVDALAESREAYWGGLVASIEAEPDPVRRLELLAGAAFGMAYASEAAYRAWGA